ncbi:MAG: serine/threonine protein kinase [Myxococcaceae bacterium]|nr:serine/threonine protein kinase [Myxococcaceae bacterium]
MSLVGRHIGRYRILEQLGQGGMSVVYKGLDTTLDREVAVKVLHPHLSGKEESRKRLAREAKAVARLHHPNILEVFDFSGIESSEAYIVTEYIRGQTLRQFVTEQPLSPPEVAAMVVHQIAAALTHAHEAGVIHRDLKPENVMVRDDGLLKLMDFGIAKILDRDEKMTMTGALVGSPAHMAPEIIEGEEAGAEADVFSLGTMLYLFATGQLPFTAANTTATLRRILEGIYTDPRQVTPTVSDDLAEIISLCLQRQPTARYANAGKLRDALGAYLAELGLGRVNEELASFFADPPSYRKALQARITGAFFDRAEKAFTDKRQAKAISSLNLVLAYDAHHARALALLDAMRRLKVTQARTAKLRQWGAVALGCSAAVVASYAAVAKLKAPPELTLPLVADPLQVVLPKDTWPAAPPPAPTPVTVAAPTNWVPPTAEAPRQLFHKNAGLAAQVPVEVLVKPYGYLTVDAQPRRDASPRHMLSLGPGKHSLTVSCEYCVSTGRTVELDIKLGEKPGPVRMVAPLKPSSLSFRGPADDAVVRIGAEQRTVAESRRTPFKIEMPPDGYATLKHQVTVEVTQGGKTTRREQSVVPGEAALITLGE